jgi:hypothetical protein
VPPTSEFVKFAEAQLQKIAPGIELALQPKDPEHPGKMWLAWGEVRASYRMMSRHISFRADMPPQTLPRERGSVDFMEKWSYYKGRLTRRWNALDAAARRALYAVVTYPVYAAVVFRLVCMMVPGVGFVVRRIVSVLGASEAVNLHTSWFETSPYLDSQIADQVLWTTITAAWRLLTSDILKVAVRRTITPVFHVVIVLVGDFGVVFVLLVPCVIYYGAKRLLRKVREDQSNEFYTNWDNPDYDGPSKKRVLGGCQGMCKCDCIGERLERVRRIELTTE